MLQILQQTILLTLFFKHSINSACPGYKERSFQNANLMPAVAEKSQRIFEVP